MGWLDATIQSVRPYASSLAKLGMTGMNGATWAAMGSVGAHGAVFALGLHFAHPSTAPTPTESEVTVDVEVAPSVAPEPLPLVVPADIPTEIKHDTPLTPTVRRATQPRGEPSASAPASPSGSPNPEAPREAEAAITADNGTPSFALPPVTAGIPGGTGTLSQGPVSAGGGAREGLDSPLAESAVSARAHLLRGGMPSYPPRARADGYEGDVVMELVLSTSGTVESAHVARGLGHGLDDAAVAAVQGYRFSPAQKDGHAVRVRMLWTMQFRLQ